MENNKSDANNKKEIGLLKKEIIDNYDKIQSQIDVRTEILLMSLPEALKKSREELLERIKEEKEKNLAALADDSPLMRHKNEYQQRFIQLKQEYINCGDDQAKKNEIHQKIQELRKDVQVLEDFLEDFKNRTLCFEEADKSVYASLIGELVTADELNQNESIESSS